MAPRSIAVLLCVLLVLAGCVGGNGGDTNSTTTTAAPGGNGGTGGGNGGDGGGSGDLGEWDPYEFQAGEFYRFELFEAGSRVGEVSWEVLSRSADGQSVTVEVSGTVDGESFSTTTTGTPETLYTSLLMNPAGSMVFVALYSPFVGAFQGETLAVGEGWSFSDGGTTVSYRIERTDSIAGRDVFVAVVRENGTPLWETWVDPELAFAAKTIIYDEGTVDLEVRLVEYRN